MEIIDPVSCHQTRGDDIVGHKRTIGLVRDFFAFVFVLFLMIVRRCIAISERCDRDPIGIKPKRQRPRKFRSFEQKPVLTKHAGIGKFGIHEVPRVQVLVVERTKSRQITTALDFKSAGDVGDFSKRFFQFTIPVTGGVLIEKIVRKSFKIFRAQ